MNIYNCNVENKTADEVAEIANTFWANNGSPLPENLKFTGEIGIRPVINAVFDACNNYQCDISYNDSEERKIWNFESFNAMF